MAFKFTTTFSFLLFSCLSFSGFGQAKEVLSVPTQRASTIITEPSFQKAAMAISLPFRDDFSKKGFRPDSTLWEDNFVFINSTLCDQPPSIGVATFDGINERGSAYNINSLATDTADILTSKPIDLTGTSGTTVLSFWYQPQGNALSEPPENNDSLALYFYNPTNQTWSSVWRDRGQKTQPFRFVGIEVGPTFLKNNFQFRFVSYGAGAGAYDMWHLDYLELNDQRLATDTITNVDIAFTAPHPSLLLNYESVPWFHYDEISNSGLKQNLGFTYIRHIPNGASSNPDLGVYKIEQVDGTSGNRITLAENTTGTIGIDASHLDNKQTVFSVPIPPFANPNFTPTDEFSFEAYQTFRGQNDARFPTNDTVRTQQQFKNYYAYDDGTAERGYGIENEPNALTIAKYDVLDFATLKGLYLNFIPANVDITNNSFKLVVYENDAGIPGNLIYESDSDYVPAYTDQNFFLPYVLDTTGIDIANSVFIGVKQKTGSRLNIGFDINTTNKTTFFFGPENNLFQSFLTGTLMMRPFFNYLPKDISVTEKDLPETEINVFPNPVTEKLYVDIGTEKFDDYTFSIYNQSGQMMAQGNLKESINLVALPNGFYLFKIAPIHQRKALPLIKKLIIAH